MTEQSGPGAPPLAVTRRARRLSIIWIVPVVALLIGGWLAWDTRSKQGPTITVTFDDAEGLQAEQSQLKYKDIVLGTVKTLALTPDNGHVVATIATTREAEPLLTKGTVFWVVKPRLFAGNLSGLDTLLSGSYVSLVPGEAGGPAERHFTGQEDPPILHEHIPGRIFLLKSPRVGSLSVGSPVFFRDLTVGEVLGWDVAGMANSVMIHVFVRAPYDSYVHDETRFWNASGLSVKLGARGLQVEMESIRAVLLGGIAFDTPDEEAARAPAQSEHEFPLFADRDAAADASYSRVISAVSYFTGSVRGLSAGSDVSMQGMKIGEVTHVRLIYKDGGIVAKVRYQLQPERIAGIKEQAFKTDTEAVNALLDRGLRASLDTASLLTGQQTVALQLVPHAARTAIAMDGDRFILPAVESGGGFAGLAASATDVLNNVNKIPFAQVGANLNGLLLSLHKATEGPALREAIANLATTLAAAHTTLDNANHLVKSVDSGYGNDTKFARDLDRLLTQSEDTVRSIRALADSMTQHPEGLIKGRKE